MAKGKHTPGPWGLCYDGQIDGPKGKFICSFRWGSYKEFNDDKEDQANARLIAAAPDTKRERDRLLAAAYRAVIGENPMHPDWYEGMTGDAIDELTIAIANVEERKG